MGCLKCCNSGREDSNLRPRAPGFANIRRVEKMGFARTRSCGRLVGTAFAVDSYPACSNHLANLQFAAYRCSAQALSG
jgi:hypothetical protein